MNNHEIKNAVLYCRVSTKEQAEEGNSLVSQERICREYAAKNGYDVLEVFIEKGESAKTADRTELKRLIKFCTAKKGLVQAVIAYKVDRISRNIADYSQIRVLLKRFKIEIKSVTEYFEDTPAGRFMENIIANVSQFDNDVRTERSIGGMKEAVQEGRYVWKAPLGYSNVKINGKSTITPNSQAPLIKRTFELIAERMDSTDTIRLLMAREGLVSNNNLPVAHSYFFRMIRNPLYTGIITMFGNRYQGTFDPIISTELFTNVQNALAKRKKTYKQYKANNPDFPLRSFITDGNGNKLTGYWAKGRRLKYPFYTFKRPKSTIRTCILEDKFMTYLTSFGYDAKHLKELRKQLITYLESNVNSGANSRQIFEQQILDINEKIDVLIKLHSGGGISVQTFNDRVSKLEAELQDIQELLKNSNDKEYSVAELMSFAIEILKNPALLWQKLRYEKKLLLQRFYFPQGIIFDGQNCKTDEVCRLFNLKTVLEERFIARVPSSDENKNTLSRTNCNKVFSTKEFWVQIAEELMSVKHYIGEEVPKSSLQTLEPK